MPPTADATIEYLGAGVERKGSRLLSDVRLTIHPGEFVFLVGPTGAGKSTLLRLLTGEIRCTSGWVRYGGEDLARYRGSNVHLLRRRMGIVPQDYALLPRKTVWENVAYAMRAVGHRRREVRRRVPEILEAVGVGHRLDAFPHELSGGEQQRVAIGRALINRPPLLIADEPTGNLDDDRAREIMELLVALNEGGTTVIVATHDMGIVERMGRRVVRLEKGNVVSDVA